MVGLFASCRLAFPFPLLAYPFRVSSVWFRFVLAFGCARLVAVCLVRLYLFFNIDRFHNGHYENSIIVSQARKQGQYGSPDEVCRGQTSFILF
jgi:hypothetical protein